MNYEFRVRGFLLLLFLFLATLQVSGQHTVKEGAGGNDSLAGKNLVPEQIQLKKILIVPFSPKMYMSNAQRQIAEGSDMNYTQILERMRYGMVMSLNDKISPFYDPVPLFKDDAKDSIQYLQMIYESVSYRYQSVRKTESDPPSLKLRRTKDNVKKGASDPYKGQIVSTSDTAEKYMSTLVLNPDLLSTLSAKFGTELFLFMNEMDLNNELSDYAAVETQSNQREIKLHYSVIDQEGNEVLGGLAKAKFPAGVNQPNDIVKNYFPLVADEVVKGLKPKEKAVKDEK